MSRGSVSDREIEQIVPGVPHRVDGGGWIVATRLDVFFAAADSLGRAAEFFDPIKRLFLGLGPERFRDLAIGPLFGRMLDAKVDPTETAFAFLEAGIFVRSSLNVLGGSVNDPASLERLGRLLAGLGQHAQSGA